MKRIVLLSATLVLGTLALAEYVTHPQYALKMTAGGHSSMGTGVGKMGDQATGHGITIDNFSFSPAVLTIPAGTAVTWTNKDDIPHTIVNTDQKFKSKALDTDDSFTYTFSQPGTYEYFCSLHPKMTAKIIVEAKQ